MNILIVREYLESLKEDGQLDYLFPMLLEVMGFTILETPKNSKGQKQFGKDIVAVGIDEDGVKRKFYFELKGGSDRDITSSNFNKEDGIVSSLYEAKFVEFPANSIAGFNELPFKIVLVHNGILKTNVRDLFEGFIGRTFKNNDNGEEFERWDIYKLTQLFTEHLFGEYLLTNPETTHLFKRVLISIDVPESNHADFRQLVNKILDSVPTDNIKQKSRLPVKIIRLFETLKLIALITHHYSEEAENLELSKKHVSFLVLKTWSWILKSGLEENKKILSRFDKLVSLQFQFLTQYILKIGPFAVIKNGLFSERGGHFERIGYPLRSMEFICYLHYWFLLDKNRNKKNPYLNKKEQNEYLVTIINANSGVYQPLIDIHSIPIVETLLFFIKNQEFESAESYLTLVFQQLIAGKNNGGRLPDGHNNIEAVTELIVSGKKNVFYEDSTSNLIGNLFEIIAVLGLEEKYKLFKEHFKEIDLAIFVPLHGKALKEILPEETEDLEQLLFEREIREEGVQSEIRLNDNFIDFKTKTFAKDEYEKISWRTDKAGYNYLRFLAHIYFQTPLFPKDWRKVNT